MAENNAPRNLQDDELSVEELESAAGGVINNCPNTNCPCTGGTTPSMPGTTVGTLEPRTEI